MNKEIDLANWMSTLPRYLRSVPLNMLAIPGSHNSYSYAIDSEDHEDRARDPIYQHFITKVDDDLAVTVSYRWSVTQILTLTEQLDLGVRYFDLKVTARAGVDGVYLKNGPNILNALNEFKAWLDLHPKEILILDFTETLQLSGAQHRRVLSAMTREIFGNKLLDYVGNVSGISLKNMHGIGAQVIVFYPIEYTFGYLSVWPSNSIAYAEPEVQTPKHLIEKLNIRQQHGRPTNVFYCWKAVLTPTMEYITRNLTGCLRENMGKPATKAAINWSRTMDIRNAEINIVAVDFVENYDFCKEIILVNTNPMRPLHEYEFNRDKSCVVL